MKVTTVCFTAIQKHWEKLRELANSEGLNLSAKVRQLIARELRRAQQEATARQAK